MKIAYMSGSLNRGGAETLLLDVFCHSSKAGFECIGIHRKEGTLKEEFYASGVNMYRLYPRCLVDVFYFLKLRKVLKSEKVNIVHAQQYLDALYAKIACIGSGIKVAQTLHGYDDLNAGRKNRLLACSLKWSDRNVYVSHVQKKYFVDKYRLEENRQEVVYNGVAFDKLQLPQDTQESSRTSEKPSLRLGTVGNFVRGRDQMTICRFLNLLNEKGVDFEFFFVGAESKAEPERYADCLLYCEEKGLSDKVHFLGSRDDVPCILAGLDAFIYSSEHDTFGIAVIEAMASGVPVFVNDWDVMLEITNQGAWADIYQTKNEEDLLKHFMLFLEQRTAYRQKALMVSERVRNTFDIKRHMESLEKLYNKLEN